ncbi:MAG: OadG family protein [Synergistaceae bacterium]|jgi:predicted lipid-binding transport protein (Tim44 family)|nr:OadG family protein [Synergistaceae bacterium]
MSQYMLMSFFWLLFAIVAVSLVFLVVIGVTVIAIMKKMCASGQERPYQRDDSQGGSAQTQAPVPVGIQAAPAPTDDEDEIVAVITAAVTALCGPRAGVVSITPSGAGSRHGTGSAWRLTGRLQNFEGFSDI